MATLNANNYMTLASVVELMNLNGSEVHIAKGLESSNAILATAPVVEANGYSFHTVGREVKGNEKALQERRYNQGTKGWFGKTETIKEPISTWEELIEIDEKIVDEAPEGEKARTLEYDRHVRNFGDQLETLLFYGAETTDNQIKGLITRRNALGDYCINAGGTVTGGATSNLASMVLVDWHPNECALCYPKGGAGGITDQSLGKYVVNDAVDNTGKYVVYGHKFNLSQGLFVADESRVQRLANVAVTAPSASATGSLPANAVNMLIAMINKAPSSRTIGNAGGKLVLYVPMEVKTQFDIWAATNSNLCRFIDDPILGNGITSIGSVPVMVSSAMIVGEEQVS